MGRRRRPKGPPRAWKGFNARLRRAAGMRCPYCQDEFVLEFDHPRSPTKEHVVPKSTWSRKQRRRNEVPTMGDKIIVACHSCNTDKQNLSLDQWWRRLLDEGDRKAVPVAAFLDMLDEGVYRICGIGSHMSREYPLGIVDTRTLRVKEERLWRTD
jgi:hypothetical protein